MARLFTNPIADHLVNLVRTQFSQLQTVAKGDLGLLSAANLASMAPGVIVEPRQVSMAPANAGHSFENDYYFRVYYFRQSVTGPGAKESLVNETEPIVELLLENFQLPGFEQPNCMGVHEFPTVIEYAVAMKSSSKKCRSFRPISYRSIWRFIPSRGDDGVARIKYVGPVRPGVETSSGIYFEFDKPVEVPASLAAELLKQGHFRSADNRKKG